MKIGLTGNIGSGKSYICKIFNNLNIPTFDSDTCAKSQYDIPRVKQQIIDLFGEQIYENNKINKKLLSNKIFSNSFDMDKLMEIVSVGVREEYYNFHNTSKSPFTIFESGIIFERKIEKIFDKIICVSTPLLKRIEYLQLERGLTQDVIRNIIKNQFTTEEIERRSDFIIYNDNKHDVEKQCLTIYQKLIDGKNNSNKIDS
jgi:dephospho-CoA kinase